ncbi:TPA: type I glyceraldehyde-3-phosphate dehydrogenase [Campylobacter lari]|uniref:type I glyceraldehyde-3-phosphate dehydrogenase n=1 Tax=Campylobacter sp. CNRCH_2015_0338h TaxID=2911605 RepID=UPI001859DEF6|nr:type I glyceraldehyde-3-phosphate dehydrogenase [Campylobacter sp. CNRCH_2015_0338h]EAI5466444.1 type I glyceraldehyde-3-phosphate dehydrogenase [Campylobacter lari]EAI7262211.1 type I glyceraldehyde-3-phosphate dehydrogenase [Campylobacter lari]MCV3471478.1 type I glyceraldehyde-3-phosphate dehydrogenase [Campylobacter sp. CNRCH_2015_0338h]HEC1763553.1 type I glyceraldehyde-3-phosphate dehydrogenase [Campylobacter lari]HEC1790740.1 type I glyceraldehyde-3-phosphate dehydrogenase [Campyloba
MAVKVAINGFGRIGRCVARIIMKRDDIELVAINDTTDIELTKYLFKYDTVHGVYDGSVENDGDDLIIDNKKIKVLKSRNVADLDFAKYGAQIVLECTGAHLTMEKCQGFLDHGVQKVIMSAPAKDKTPTYVLGVNAHEYKGENIISNASCTTNCLGPICRVLQDNFGIEKGLMTTIHAYTNGQSIIDAKARDKRRSRAAAQNIIPTSTGAAKAMKLVMPELDGKLHGQSMRVPVADVSTVDLTATLKKKVSKEEINEAFRKAAASNLKGILLVDDEERVSSDFITCSYGAIVASDLTQVICDDFVKVVAWYDNEWGYSSRLVDMAVFAAKA